MKHSNFILLTALLVFIASSQHTQQCLDEQGNPVDWWVILNIPGKSAPPVGTFTNDKGKEQSIYNYPGYAYFDSNDHKAGRKSFHVNEESPDGKNTALGKTLGQIKKTKMNTVAWNDQPCGRGSSPKVSAHSKAIGAYDQHSKRGFFISHSIPRYPCFNDNQVNISINYSQQQNGQDMLCISGDDQFVKNMISKVPPMLPNYYEQNYNCNSLFGGKLKRTNSGQNTGDCSKLFGSNGIDNPDFSDTFSYFDYEVSSGIDFKMIFKRSDSSIQQSILDQGVTGMLESSILSQTWHGRTQSLVCPRGYKSSKVLKMQLNDKHAWASSIDHSKWIVATDNNYVCYGDMNRQVTQLPRGGAFYCLNSPGLHTAMSNLIKCDGCTQSCENSGAAPSSQDNNGNQHGQEDEQL